MSSNQIGSPARAFRSAPRGIGGLRRLGWALTVGAPLALLSACGDNHDCNGCYAAITPNEVEFGLVVADFNGDGLPDVVATSDVRYSTQPAQDDNLKVYLSTGVANSFATPVFYPASDDQVYLAAADLNGDHLPDIVSVSASTGTLAVFFNNKLSPGTFNSPLILSSPGASQVAIGDLNNDGLPDLISADYGVSLFLQTSAGTFAAPISLYSGGANQVAVGDLNGDGAPDVVLTDNVGVKVLFHTGAASATTFAAPVSVFTQTQNAGVIGANIVAVADVNGDGLQDLVISDPGPAGGAAPTVSVLLQDPANHGQFLAPVGYSIPPNGLTQSIVVVDLNGDGHPDIVLGGSSAVTVLLQDATHPGTFLAASSYPTPQGAFQVAVADINGDGRPDIVVTNGVTNPVENGTITTHPGVLPQSAAAPGTFLALQDLP